MATLTVSNTQDFSADTLSNITVIDFVHPTNAAVATFANTQFDNSAILNNVQLDGSNPINAIVVNGGSINASLWTFASWAPADTITLNGSASGDAITGSSEKDTITGGLGGDTITGGLGADTLVGGDGDDIFVYNAVAELAAGETIDGGIGTADTLRINIGDGFQLNVSGAGVLAGVEKVVFTSGSEGRFAAASFGTAAGLINAVTGSAGENSIRIFDSAIDLSGVAFSAWTVGEDAIILNGTVGNDTIVGSSQNDVINSLGGTDSLSGGAGDDVFQLVDNGFALGATIDGGSGIDDRIITELADLSLGTVIGVERLVLSQGASAALVTSAIASGSQIGLGAIATIVGFLAQANNLIVNGGTVNLTGVTFTNWTAGQDTITINGTAGNDSLTGSNQFDTFNGGLGNDTYGLGADNDAVNDTGGTDTITSTVSRDLSAFAAIENLTLLGAAANGTGNALANILTGNAVANVLSGGDGADSLFGGDGGDRLIGGLGVDLFTGGAGADTFAFTTLADSGKKPAARDTILDFTKGDFIDLSAIDAKKGGADNAFKFIGKHDFHDKKGELHFTKKSGDVTLSGDVDGNGKADFAILFADINKLVGGDFVL